MQYELPVKDSKKENLKGLLKNFFKFSTKKENTQE